MCIKNGLAPEIAIQMATLNAAECYNLKNKGAIDVYKRQVLHEPNNYCKIKLFNIHIDLGLSLHSLLLLLLRYCVPTLTKVKYVTIHCFYESNFSTSLAFHVPITLSISYTLRCLPLSLLA